MRETPWLFVVTIVAALIGLYYVLSESHVEGRSRVQYENLAMTRLNAVGKAEMAFHKRTGRYGWLSELKTAALLKGVPTGDVDGDEVVPSPRYRIDVLLPHSMSPADKVRIGPKAAGRSNPNLEERHFAVVARPWGDAPSGYRTFYRDENGNVYVSEGVSDMAARANRPLPDLHLTYSPVLYAGGLRWYRLDQLPER